jgi:hypothetical protein
LHGKLMGDLLAGPSHRHVGIGGGAVEVALQLHLARAHRLLLHRHTRFMTFDLKQCLLQPQLQLRNVLTATSRHSLDAIAVSEK